MGTAVLANLPWSAGAAAHRAGLPAEEAVSSEWQHHKATFNYFGITTLFTCDGLEDHVRQILLHLGARQDARVTATGCPGPFNAPSHDAWVNADFYSLAAAADSAAPDAVNARWTVLEMRPQRPSFIGNGDCELIRDMKDLITRNFPLREVAYRTDCFPHDVTLDSFEVKGQALRAVPPGQKAARASG